MGHIKILFVHQCYESANKNTPSWKIKKSFIDSLSVILCTVSGRDANPYTVGVMFTLFDQHYTRTNKYYYFWTHQQIARIS